MRRTVAIHGVRLKRVSAIVTALASGCTPSLRVTADANIACASNADCPAPWVCRTAVGRCVDPARSDHPPPELVSTPLIEPSRGRAGTTFSATVTFVAPLGADPVLVASDDAFVFALMAGDVSRPSYVYGYTALGTEPERAVQLEVRGLDKFGTAFSIAGPTVEFDFTPPALVSAGAINESSVTVIFSEPLASVGTYSIAPPLQVLAVSASDQRTVTLLTTAQEGGTLYTVQAAGGTDLVGNVLPDGAAASFTGLGTAPDSSAPVPLLPPPDGRVTTGEVLLVWTPRTKAQSYSVEVAALGADGADAAFATAALAGSPFTVEAPMSSLGVTLPDSVTYVWRVRADVTEPDEYGQSTFDALGQELYVYCAADPCSDAGHAGNKTRPFATLARALADAQSLGLTRIDVAARPGSAAYDEILTVRPPLELYGGWDPSFTARDPAAHPTLLAVASAPSTLRLVCSGIAEPLTIDGFEVTGPDLAGAVAVDVFGCGAGLRLANDRIHGGSVPSGDTTALRLWNAGTPSDAPSLTSLVVTAGDVTSDQGGTTCGICGQESYAIIADSEVVTGDAQAYGNTVGIRLSGGGAELLRTNVHGFGGAIAGAACTALQVTNGLALSLVDSSVTADGAVSQSTGLDVQAVLMSATGTAFGSGASFSSEAARVSGGSAGGPTSFVRCMFRVADGAQQNNGLIYGGGPLSLTDSTILCGAAQATSCALFLGGGTGHVIARDEVHAGACGAGSGYGASVGMYASADFLVEDSQITGGDCRHFPNDNGGSYGLKLVESQAAVRRSTLQAGNVAGGTSAGVLHIDSSQKLVRLERNTIIAGTADGGFTFAVSSTSSYTLAPVLRLDGNDIRAADQTAGASPFGVYINTTSVHEAVDVVNNIIRGGANTSPGGQTVAVLLAPPPASGLGVGDGAIVLANNTIVSGPASGPSYGVELRIRATLANNVVFTSAGTTRMCIVENGPAASPLSFENNLLFDCPTALYAEYDASGACADLSQHNCLTSIDDVNDATRITTGTGVAAGNLTAADLDTLAFSGAPSGDYRLTPSTPAAVRKLGKDTSKASCGTGSSASCGSVLLDAAGVDRSCPTEGLDCYSIGAFAAN